MNLMICVLLALTATERAEEDIASIFPDDAPHVRYLYLDNVEDNEKDNHLAVISFILNSVSNKKKITLPKFVDKGKNLIRFDIRDYGIEAKNYSSIGRDPYTKKSDKLQVITKCDNPLLRADWFIAKAMVAPAYYKLLGVSDLKSFRKKFDHDPDNSKKQRVEQAAVVFRSSLARNTRYIKRSSIVTGAIWEARESASINYLTDLLSDKYDSIELLASNPNGLISYFAAGQDGKPYDHLNVDIAVDHSKAFDPDLVVRVARNCVACHSQGVIPVEDGVRKLFEKSKDIELLAPSKDAMDRLSDLFGSELPVARDQQIYTEALAKATGMTPATFTKKFVAVQNIYYADVTLEQAARELGKPVDDFKKECVQSGQFALVTLAVRGKLPRVHFEEVLKDK